MARGRRQSPLAAKAGAENETGVGSLFHESFSLRGPKVYRTLSTGKLPHGLLDAVFADLYCVRRVPGQMRHRNGTFCLRSRRTV